MVQRHPASCQIASDDKKKEALMRHAQMPEPIPPPGQPIPPPMDDPDGPMPTPVELPPPGGDPDPETDPPVPLHMAA
jgi:hypothetical protein